MKIYAPSYYKDFKCIANKCRHTCCGGWQIDVDVDSLPRFLSNPDVKEHIEVGDEPHIILKDGEICPFLRDDGLCQMMISNGEDYLCQICRDHPRFRNFWTGVTEIGVGLVCEEAARLVLSQTEKFRLVLLDDDGKDEKLSDDEQWLWDVRQKFFDNVTGTGPEARLKEYLIFRHLPNALYDGLIEERIRFIKDSYKEITDKWKQTDGSFEALVECVRLWSYDVEYDTEKIATQLAEYSKK